MGGIVCRKIIRPSKDLIRAFRKLPTTIVSDSLNRSYAMKADLRPIYESIRICGPAVTVQSMCGNNIGSHIALSFCQKGDVIVIDGRGHTDTSIWGGVQAYYAKKIGIEAVIIDGSIRDVAEMKKMRLPVFCKGIVPTGPHKGWADSVNIPIQCAGVPVTPGDLIIGDDDGVVVVPRERLKEILKLSQQRLAMEKRWKQELVKGKNTLEAVGLKEKIKNLDLEYR